MEPLKDKQGNIMFDEDGRMITSGQHAYQAKTNTRLLEMKVKRHLPEYRDKAEVEHTIPTMDKILEHLAPSTGLPDPSEIEDDIIEHDPPEQEEP